VLRRQIIGMVDSWSSSFFISSIVVEIFCVYKILFDGFFGVWGREY